ncbi:hypothetical protein [Actinokineospora sp. NPDC004072]
MTTRRTPASSRRRPPPRTSPRSRRPRTPPPRLRPSRRRPPPPAEDITLSRWQTIAAIATPTTLASALLFYFGYVSTLARYEHFGVDLAVLDLSTVEVLMLGTEVVFPPLAFLLVLMLLALAAHQAVSALMHRHRRAAHAVSAAAGVLGLLMFVRGGVGVLWVSVSEEEFPGLTPICLGLGLPLLAYGLWVLREVRAPGKRARGINEVLILVGLAGMAVIGLFWATNIFAGAYGRGRAAELAAELDTRPMVVLDLQQRLYLPADLDGVQQFDLPGGDPFRVRCQGLRLLTEAGGRLFLVPARWDGPGRRTIVVPNDESVRVQFLPD